MIERMLTGNDYLGKRRFWPMPIVLDGSHRQDRETRLLSRMLLDSREISSAVSAVLRGENFSCSEAAGAERCGYGDLQ